MSDAEIDSAIGELETEMEHLYRRRLDMFAFANAWAERYDAIVARAPEGMRESVERRLHRVGVRWGMAAGVRMTGQFPALKLSA